MSYWLNQIDSAISLSHIAIFILLTAITQIYISKLRHNERKKWAKITTTADLHKEFNGDSMSAHRGRAYAIVELYADKLASELDDVIAKDRRIKKEEAAEVARSVFIVMRFYQRMSALTRDGALRSDMVFDLFGETFTWWNTVYFAHGFQEWETASKDLKWFANWLDAHAKSKHPIRKISKLAVRSREQREKVSQLSRWKEKAEMDLRAQLMKQSKQ